MSQKNTNLKPESQKDLLFSKLLPALNHNPFSSTYEGEVLEPLDLTSEKTDDDPLSALRSRLFARPETNDRDTYSTVNVMESLVLQHLDAAIKRFNACSCNRCRCDVAAYALNALPPKYIVSDPEKAAKIANEIPSADILKVLVNAVIHVRSNPRH